MKEVKDLHVKSNPDLRKLSAEKLHEELEASQRRLYTLKMKLANGEQKQTHLIKVLRRYVAILHTLVKQVKN